MEDYERRKLYRVHLKNISQIKNCRTPQIKTAYSSRLFNFNSPSVGHSLRKEGKDRYTTFDHDECYRETCRKKWCHDREQINYQRMKENVRLRVRILHTSGSINMKKYEHEYKEHRKIMNLHRKVKEEKRSIIYRIYDIVFKGITPDLREEFTLYDVTGDKKEQPEELIRGNIFQLRQMMIKGFRKEKLTLRVEGRGIGIIHLEADRKMQPLMWRKEIVGNVIMETF